MSNNVQTWWGVMTPGGRWTFDENETIVHYPHFRIAEAHAESISPDHRAVAFNPND